MSCDYLRSVSIRRLPQPVEGNPVWSALGSAISSIVAVALSLPFLLAFLLLVPACLSVRWLLLFIHYSRQGSRSDPGAESVRGNESRWLGSAWRSSVINAILVFEAKEGVNVDHFRRLLLQRVIPLYPRLTQRLISLPMSAGVGNRWLTDSKFSIDDHVFSGPSFLTNDKALQDYVSKLVDDGLPENKSPWQLQVFQSFGPTKDTVLILRVHQSVADGTALMRLLCHSLADSQAVEIPETPRFGSVAFCMDVVRACMAGPLTLLLWLFLSGEDCNVFSHRSAWTGSVTVTWSASITLPKVTRIKQVTRSTVNCVLLSALAGALRRFLQGCGVRPTDVKVVVPMDLRSQDLSTPAKRRLGNKTSSMVVPLPVAVEGCIPRLWATRKTLESRKTSADPVILYVATAALMSVGSASLARHLVDFLADKASLQFSSLPGPTSEIFLEGQTLKGIYPILPAQANLGISVSTITYADQIFVSVIAERALGPAAELILEYLEDQIEVLWKLLLNRRVPGEPQNPATLTRTTISESPIKEIASRLNLVQNEVERLSEGKENDKDGKLCILRAELSELVDELKRRQSSSEKEDLDKLWTPRHKAFSCSVPKKQIGNLSPHRRRFNPYEPGRRHPGDLGQRPTDEKPQTSDSLRSPPPKPSCCGSRSKDCIIFMSDNGGNAAIESAPKNDVDDAAVRNPSGLPPSKNSEPANHSLPRRQTWKADEMKLGERVKWPRDETETLKSKKENPNSSDELSDCTGPNPSPCCDLTYKHFLDVDKVNEKRLIQAPRHYYEFTSDDYFEDSDESESAGGLLI